MADRERPAFDKAARQAERARTTRLSRLPFLHDYALQGRTQQVVATLVQAALVVVPVLGLAKPLTGSWLPTGITFVVLGVAFAVTWLSRYLNARAGRT